MPSKNDRISAVLVYLERKKTRLYVGKLHRTNNEFVFEYDNKYLYSKNTISLGPEFPLTQRIFKSKTLFIPFSDRLPSRENPAYADYCKAMGIDVNEQDPFILLTTIGSRGPSSFIFAPEYILKFDRHDLKTFRKNLGLSVRDFSEVFDFSQAALTRVEKGKSSGKELLKRAAIYASFPAVALSQLKYRGNILHVDRRRQMIDYLALCQHNKKHY